MVRVDICRGIDGFCGSERGMQQNFRIMRYASHVFLEYNGRVCFVCVTDCFFFKYLFFALFCRFGLDKHGTARMSVKLFSFFFLFGLGGRIK